MCTRTALPTPPRCRHALPAFTLLELIVVIAIVVLLIALLLPALGGVMTSARGFRCQMSMRTVAFDFAVFADESLQFHGFPPSPYPTWSKRVLLLFSGPSETEHNLAFFLRRFGLRLLGPLSISRHISACRKNKGGAQK